MYTVYKYNQIYIYIKYIQIYSNICIQYTNIIKYIYIYIYIYQIYSNICIQYTNIIKYIYIKYMYTVYKYNQIYIYIYQIYVYSIQIYIYIYVMCLCKCWSHTPISQESSPGSGRSFLSTFEGIGHATRSRQGRATCARAIGVRNSVSSWRFRHESWS